MKGVNEMTIEQANIVSDLCKQRNQYQELLSITRNYDAKIQASFSSLHNENTKRYIERTMPLPKNIQDEIVEYIKGRISEIDKEIESI